MTALRDLTQCTGLLSSAEHILAVGWLEKGVEFPVGPTAEDVFARLREFAKDPWQPSVACGVYEYDLCQFEGECGGANLFFPYQGKIYVCPELITHYINAHHYQPPAVFCEAVLACPPMHSMDYKRLLIACKGRVLWSIPPDCLLP